MNLTTRTQMLLAFMVGMICLSLTLSAGAQVQSSTSTTSQTPTVTSKTVSGTVVYVGAHDLIVKMDDGSLKHFTNVPDTATAMVDGKPITIKDAKVGMKLSKTVTTTTMPRTITTTQTVTGKVWQVNPPRSVVLSMDNGENQMFKIPEGQKFNVNGQTVDAWGLKKGMVVSATKVVEVPETVISQQAKVTGSMPPPPPPPAPDATLLIPVAAPAPAAPPPPAETAAATLPKTGSSLPLIGELGLLLVATSLGMKAVRSIR